MSDILNAIMATYGTHLPDWAIGVLLIVSSLRLIMKPLVTILRVLVKWTPTQSDDSVLAACMNTRTYKVISFLLDLVASIKLPKGKADGPRP